MKKFISIDLDYWGFTSNFGQMCMFLHHLQRIADKVVVTLRHDQIIDIVNRSEFTDLYNVDTHADLFTYKAFNKHTSSDLYERNGYLNSCWINCVMDKSNKNLVWYYNNYPENHRINVSHACYGDDPFENGNNKFNSSSVVCGLPKIMTMDKQDVSCVTVTLSLNYCINKSAADLYSFLMFEKLYNEYSDRNEEYVKIVDLPSIRVLDSKYFDISNVRETYSRKYKKYNNLIDDHPKLTKDFPNNLKVISYNSNVDKVYDMFNPKRLKEAIIVGGSCEEFGEVVVNHTA